MIIKIVKNDKNVQQTVVTALPTETISRAHYRKSLALLPDWIELAR
jgi:hypothetical protein